MLNSPCPRVKMNGKVQKSNNRTPKYQCYTGMKAWITLPAEEHWPVYVKVKVTQSCPNSFFFSCPTLCDPMDYTVHGIFQARILEWVAFPFSRGWLRRNVKCLWKEKCRDSHYSPVTNFLNEDYYIFAYFPFCSVPELCLTLCNPVDGSTPGFPVLHYPLEFAQIHVYWVRDAI